MTGVANWKDITNPSRVREDKESDAEMLEKVKRKKE